MPKVSLAAGAQLMMRGSVWPGEQASRPASPKSRSFGPPSSWNPTLLGLMSRCSKPGSVKLYKRLKRQWVFGVCRGLAEASRLSVWLLRAVFILLLFGGKIGWAIAVPLYLLLAMSLQVHPEDRRLLLRFKLKRWRENRGMQG